MGRRAPVCMNYRPLPDDDAGEELFARYVQYAFRPDAGPAVDDRLADDDRPDPPRVRRGLYRDDDDEPVSICSSYDFATQLRGAVVSMGGVATVATPPEHRRRGYVETLMRELCREYREAGTPTSALWPFEHPFYRQYGWATCNRYHAWSAPPDALRSAAGEVAGTWQSVDRDEWELLAPVHDADAAGHELSVDRTADWWTERVLRGWEEDPFVYCWTDGEDRHRAYLTYRIDGDWEDRSLVVQDHAAADPAAFDQVVRFLADHDSQVSEVRFATPPDASLLDRVDDPRELDCEVEAGPMFRLVDVPATLSALSYPVEASLVVDLSDPLLPEVEGVYEVTVTDAAPTGAATCESTDAAADASLEIGAFSQLVCGYRSAERLADAGELDADRGTIATLDALFPTSSPYLRERF